MESYEILQVDYFDDLCLKSDLLRGIYSYEYEKLSDVQRKAILPILQGFDVIAQAPQDSGKSTALIIPLLQSIDEDLQECQALVLAPTLDLAQQLSYLTNRLAEFLSVSIDVCEESRNIEGAQILIGTPEMILGKLKLGSLNTNALRIIAVDGADKLAPQEEMKSIFEYMNDSIQVVMFSQIMNEDVLKIAKKYTRNPLMVLIRKGECLLERFRHFYILVDEKELKGEILLELLQEAVTTTVKALIFCNKKETVNEVAELLSKNSLTCSQLDGTMEFPDREASLKKFRAADSRFLVTTDLALGSIATQQISIVLNYDWPSTKEEYEQRIGRCNWYNRGYAISLVTPDEVKELREVEKYYGIIFDYYNHYFS